MPYFRQILPPYSRSSSCCSPGSPWHHAGVLFEVCPTTSTPDHATLSSLGPSPSRERKSPCTALFDGGFSHRKIQTALSCTSSWKPHRQDCRDLVVLSLTAPPLHLLASHRLISMWWSWWWPYDVFCEERELGCSVQFACEYS